MSGQGKTLLRLLWTLVFLKIATSSSPSEDKFSPLGVVHEVHRGPLRVSSSTFVTSSDLIPAATAFGDLDLAIETLLEMRRPVVQTRTDKYGTHTSTHSLGPDNSISVVRTLSTPTVQKKIFFSAPEPELHPVPRAPTWDPIVFRPVLLDPNRAKNRITRIEEYLAKVDLTPADILAENGELVKRIVEENGRVLTVRFTLSEVAKDAQSREPVKPIK